MRVGYIVSRFPSSTETFIAREMHALERLGAHIELFALIRQRDVVVHPESVAFLRRLRTASLLSPATWAAQWYWLRRAPRSYVRALVDITRGNLRSPGFLVRAWILFPMAARFAREVRTLRIEHVHAHWATHPALAAYVVHRLTGVPYSFTAHAHDLFVDRTMLAAKIADARFVAVISEFNRAYLRSHYGDRTTARVAVVRCGVDTQRFAPRPRPVNDEPLIVCVASLQPYKGHAVLVDALARVRDRGVPFRCVLVGDGELRASIEQLVELRGLANHVELLGARRSDEVLALLHRADIAVMPSVVARDGQMEGIPVALMEALACEVPVIASRLSGIPELVVHERNGLLVEPGDAVELAAAIESLACDASRRDRLGSAGRARIIEVFDEDANARRLFELFSTRRDATDGTRAPASAPATSRRPETIA